MVRSLEFVVLYWGLDVNVDTTAILTEIGKLPVEDQIVLVQRVWDAIADADTPLELTDAQKAEISRRSAEFDASPDMAIPWEEVKRSLMERRRRCSVSRLFIRTHSLNSVHAHARKKLIYFSRNGRPWVAQAGRRAQFPENKHEIK